MGAVHGRSICEAKGKHGLFCAGLMLLIDQPACALSLSSINRVGKISFFYVKNLLQNAQHTGVILLVMFFTGFLAIIGISSFISGITDGLVRQRDNEIIRVFVIEQIVNSIQNTKNMFDQLMPATSHGYEQYFRLGISKEINQLDEDFQVFINGGPVKRSLFLKARAL